MMRRTPMKRTGFPRKTAGPRHITEILAGEDFRESDDSAQLEAMRRHILSAIAGAFGGAVAPRPIVQTPKHEYLDDKSYRSFVASLPCFVCGAVGRSQAAHSNSAKDGKGGSIKATDAAIFPLCADDLGAIGCHTRHDQAKDGLTRDERRAREVEFIARMAAIQRP